jgi:hypothetical protein
MNRLTTILATTIVAAGLISCESSVLVNNRPDRAGPSEDAASPADQSQPASATFRGDNATIESRTSAATTRPSVNTDATPADQTVHTKNTRIESHSD